MLGGIEPLPQVAQVAPKGHCPTSAYRTCQRYSPFIIPGSAWLCFTAKHQLLTPPLFLPCCSPFLSPSRASQGGVVLRDFWRFKRANALGFCCGVVLCFAGVFLITRRPKAKRPPLSSESAQHGTPHGAADEDGESRRSSGYVDDPTTGTALEQHRPPSPTIMTVGDFTRRVSTLVSDHASHSAQFPYASHSAPALPQSHCPEALPC